MSDSDVLISDEAKCEVCGQASNEEQILLCDRCDGEFHMFCLRPKLIEVPEGEWLCPLCHEMGSSLYLQESIDKITDSRKKRRIDCGKHADCDGESDDESDEDFYSEFKFLPENVNIIGMVVRLYSFIDSCYHSGRILGKRDEEPVLLSIEDPTMTLTQPPSIDDSNIIKNQKRTEHLVLFKKGMNGRNSSVLQWLHLSDFACILCTDVVFIKLQGSGVWPAQRCYRSYWELLRQSLATIISSSSLNSNSSRKNQNTSKQQLKALKKRNKEKAIIQLKQTFGNESYVYLFGDESYMTIPRKHEQTLLIHYVTKSKHIKSFQGKRFALSCALANVEMEEQQGTQRMSRLVSMSSLEATGESEGEGRETAEGGFDLKTWKQMIDACQNESSTMSISASVGNKRKHDATIAAGTTTATNDSNTENNDQQLVALFAAVTSSSLAATNTTAITTAATANSLFTHRTETEEKVENGNGYLLKKKLELVIKMNLQELAVFKKRYYYTQTAASLHPPLLLSHSSSSSSSSSLLLPLLPLNNDTEHYENDAATNNNSITPSIQISTAEALSSLREQVQEVLTDIIHQLVTGTHNTISSS